MNNLGWLSGIGKECYGFRGPQFPQKLFTAMDAPNAVIRWTNNGKAICIDPDEYEENVLRVHPGLVEISSFANFRRQMREYAFDWLYNPETQEYEFSHPSFQRGRAELLSGVLTRRKRRPGRYSNIIGSSMATRRASVPVPRRRSVICYAGVPKTDSARQPAYRAAAVNPDMGPAKSLGDMTDEEWWTYCAPAILLGMNGDEVGVPCGAFPSIESKFMSPICFYCDDDNLPDTDKQMGRIQGGFWSHRVLDFDEL